MKFRQMVKKYAAPVVVANAAMAVGSAFAIDSAAVTDAVANGAIVVGLVVAGVVTMSALGFGLNMITGLIKR